MGKHRYFFILKRIFTKKSTEHVIIWSKVNNYHKIYMSLKKSCPRTGRNCLVYCSRSGILVVMAVSQHTMTGYNPLKIIFFGRFLPKTIHRLDIYLDNYHVLISDNKKKHVISTWNRSALYSEKRLATVSLLLCHKTVISQGDAKSYAAASQLKSYYHSIIYSKHI